MSGDIVLLLLAFLNAHYYVLLTSFLFESGDLVFFGATCRRLDSFPLVLYGLLNLLLMSPVLHH